MNSKNKYPALTATKTEPEYRENPHLAISSVGTENTKKLSGRIPYGCALLTSTGSTSDLESQGINYIIHATPMPEGSNSLENFVGMAAKAIQNSIILAEREGIRKLATCFLGGRIYCSNDSSKPSLAEGIIRAALNQIENCLRVVQIVFVDYDGEYFGDAFKKIKEEPAYSTVINKARRKVGDFCQWSTHECEAIVNSENPEMGWGGGVSSNIKKALGAKASQEVDRERHGLRDKFNELIPEEENNGGNDSAKISCRANKATGKVSYTNGTRCHLFFLESGKEINGKNSLEIDENHPVFKNNPPRAYFENNQNVIWHKITWLKSKDITEKFSPSDFIEIEEENKDENTAKYFKNDDKTCAFCSKVFAAGSGIIYNNKDYCSSECSLKRKDKDNKTASEWQEELKEISNEVGQAFDENKVNEWKEQNKFGQVEEVKKLFESVKNNSQFLDLIKTKQNSDSLEKFIADKVASEVIKVIKRFEYDNLSRSDKEKKLKKMRKHYGLGENAPLSDDQINNFVYEVAIEKIIESSLDENQQGSNNTSTPENNILKYLGISALILIPLGLLLIFLIRKRKKVVK